MHKILTIDIILEATFTPCELTKIIKKGESVGIVYFDYIPGQMYLDAPKLASDRAVHNLVCNKYENASLLCKYLDTTFYLGFYSSEENYVKISLWGIGDAWKKEFLKSDGSTEIEFDTSRYIHLLTTLSNDLKIIKLNANIEWD